MLMSDLDADAIRTKRRNMSTFATTLHAAWQYDNCDNKIYLCFRRSRSPFHRLFNSPGENGEKSCQSHRHSHTHLLWTEANSTDSMYIFLMEVRAAVANKKSAKNDESLLHPLCEERKERRRRVWEPWDWDQELDILTKKRMGKEKEEEVIENWIIL